MERYGDAPVHSLAVGMLLKPKNTHYFADISYTHTGYFTCPVNPKKPDSEFKHLCTCERKGSWIDGSAWGRGLLEHLANVNKFWNM